MNKLVPKLNLTFIRVGLVMILPLLFVFSNTIGQTYTNGILITGDTAFNGTIAPPGYTFSFNESGGIQAGIAANSSVAEDFIIPEGQAWTLSDMVFYAFSYNYTGDTSPYNNVRVKIFNTNPRYGNPEPIFGDTSTNRFVISEDSHIYFIERGAVNLNNKIWSITANTPFQLGPGHYWIEFQLGSSEVGRNINILANNSNTYGNALNHVPVSDTSDNAWFDYFNFVDNRPDFYFKINYTLCTADTTITIISTGGCIPSTLTASGADNYTWFPAEGLNTTNGATVIANPLKPTKYTVLGTSAGSGCFGTASIKVSNPFTSATLKGIILKESFEHVSPQGIPPGWIGLSYSPRITPGSPGSWLQGTSSNQVAHSAPYYSFIENRGDYYPIGFASEWLLTNVVKIRNGDKISFWTIDDSPSRSDNMELRMSTSDSSINVGDGSTIFGDFATLLLKVHNDTARYPTEWTKFEATISGLPEEETGRFALRFTSGSVGGYVGLDDFLISSNEACSPIGNTQNLSVDITGGSGPYKVVYSNGTNTITVADYTSGDLIPVSPTGPTTFSLVSVESSGGCSGTNINGTFTFTGGVNITSQPYSITSICGTNPATISIVADGTNNTYQWQLSTDGGATFTDVIDNANYNGATTTSLNISNITEAMNGYVYHVNVIGGNCPGTTTSRNSTLAFAQPIVITTQPNNITTCNYTIAELFVVSNGAYFQWQVSTDGGANFVNIGGNSDSSSLYIGALSVNMNGYKYRVIIGNGCGETVTSSVATLTVVAETNITTQPEREISVCGSSTASISVIATGPENIYQWQVSTNGGIDFTDIEDDSNYSGTNSPTLSLSNITAAMTGYIYHVKISGVTCSGISTSDNSTLEVGASTLITTQPSNTSACEGGSATFNVVSNGLNFQWQYSTDGGTTFTDITGANSATYVTNPTTLTMQGYIYRVIVGGCVNSVNSANAELYINAPAIINTQPSSTTVCAGYYTMFSITATADSLVYQWQVSEDGGSNFSNIPGANFSFLEFNSTSSMNNNQYRVVVGNGCGNTITSTSATLSVTESTVINSQPQNVIVCAGSAATFTVNATGTNLNYQWGSVSATDSTTITGANSSSYTLTGPTTDLSGTSYYVTISGECGVINSSNAILTVNPVPELTLTANSTSITEGETATITATSTPAATTYQWFKDGVAISGSTGNSIEVNHDNHGVYKASVDVNGCSATSNEITITAIGNRTYSIISPNPNNGRFKVSYLNVGNISPTRKISIFDSRGLLVYSKIFTVNTGIANEVMEVDVSHLTSGLYNLLLTDGNSNRLKATSFIKN